MEKIYSTFDVALSPLAGAAAGVGAAETVAPSAGFDAVPVCVIGTTRSASCWTVFREAVMVNTPSDDNVDCTSFGLVFAM